MILGIESSCDESALALFDPATGQMTSRLHSQLDLHAQYGGVVPDLATREHLQRFPFLLDELRQCEGWDTIDTIAVTFGPGLAGCLSIGIALAKSLGIWLGCPVIGINHLRAHAFSPFLHLYTAKPDRFQEKWPHLLPHLGLLVSGGNTLLFEINQDARIRILAETVDDAAGEALDKGAKLLNLPYPGGPIVEKYARAGDPKAFPFPRPFADSEKMAYSFSGLKTSLRYRLEKMEKADWEQRLSDLCASYQQAVVDSLLAKVIQVLSAPDNPYRSAGLSGGVANNQSLRSRFEEVTASAGLTALITRPEYTGDNAAMIAFAAHIDPPDHPEDHQRPLSFQAALTLTQK